MKRTEWSPWLRVGHFPATSPADIAEILDGGQAFCWHRDDAGIWSGFWSDCIAQLTLRGGVLHWRAPDTIQPRVAAALPGYLALNTDWPALADSLPWRSDPHLRQCIAAIPGLRILRQPFGETLLGFLCSATKQIVQIKQMIALLSERHGTEIAGGFRGLPGWPALAAVPERELRACQLGFRSRFINETALFLADKPCWLNETERLPYAEAKARLVELPGVGEKIADCVLLYGAGRLEAFPVDTWMLKTLERRYGLVGWKSSHLALFGRAHFGPLAGLAQQFLFEWERKHGGR